MALEVPECHWGGPLIPGTGALHPWALPFNSLTGWGGDPWSSKHIHRVRFAKFTCIFLRYYIGSISTIDMFCMYHREGSILYSRASCIKPGTLLSVYLMSDIEVRYDAQKKHLHMCLKASSILSHVFFFI